MGFREDKRKMRRVVHVTMRVPALYIEHPMATPVPVTVRPHEKSRAIGDLPGGGLFAATREDETPKMIFVTYEGVTPVRGAVVSIAPGEAYEIAHTELPDDEEILARVTRMSVAKAAGLPVPEAVV